MAKRQKGPKLQFVPTTAMTGFTGIDTASFNDLRPSRIVRELVQNSLDAAVEAGNKTAVIRFRVKQIGKSDVPDIAGYEEHFRAAVDEHKRNGGLPDAAQQVVDNIEKALELLKKGKHNSLSILDNGIGLDHTRMTALLGQGTSVKSVEASGSYGVGHLASIPASDLRYVLYGGVVKGGQRTVSGCAVLASRAGKSRLMAAQGYLIKRFGSGKDGKIYDFIGPRSIPDAVAADLKDIESEWGHDSAVVIPAFNCFGDDHNFSLWDVVSRVAAYNFNAAIYEGKLDIEVIDKDKNPQRLDKCALRDVLDQDKDNIRAARTGSFFSGLRPSGQNAHAAYLTQTEGEHHLVQTEDGNVDMRLLTPSPTGNTRVDLFRNGMWITDRIPGLSRADFINRQPFHAVLTLNAKEGKGLHRLIRKAEGPMHNELGFNRLQPEERKKLRAAIRQIANKIRDEIPEIGTEEYTPDDYLLIETGGQEPGGTTQQYSMWGFPVPIQRARISQRRFSESGETTEHEGNIKGTKKPIQKKSQKQRSTSRPLSFRSTAIPDGMGRHIVAIECSETFDEVLLSLRVDENMDATCDRVWPDERVLLKSFEIEARGVSAPSSKMEEDKRAIQVRGLSAGTTYKLVLEYEVPEELANMVEVPVFRVDLHSPPPSK